MGEIQGARAPKAWAHNVTASRSGSGAPGRSSLSPSSPVSQESRAGVLGEAHILSTNVIRAEALKATITPAQRDARSCTRFMDGETEAREDQSELLMAAQLGVTKRGYSAPSSCFSTRANLYRNPCAPPSNGIFATQRNEVLMPRGRNLKT